MSNQYLYDMFELYYKNAVASKKKGNLNGAKKNLLRAAEAMFSLAKDGGCELKKSRTAYAERLMALSEDIRKLVDAQSINTKQDDNVKKART